MQTAGIARDDRWNDDIAGFPDLQLHIPTILQFGYLSTSGMKAHQI